MIRSSCKDLHRVVLGFRRLPWGFTGVSRGVSYAFWGGGLQGLCMVLSGLY